MANDEASVVLTAYTEVLANLILALVEGGVLSPAAAGEVVRRGRRQLETFPDQSGKTIRAGVAGLERLARQMEETKAAHSDD